MERNGGGVVCKQGFEQGFVFLWTEGLRVERMVVCKEGVIFLWASGMGPFGEYKDVRWLFPFGCGGAFFLGP